MSKGGRVRGREGRRMERREGREGGREMGKVERNVNVRTSE